jgi:hypothetical protein
MMKKVLLSLAALLTLSCEAHAQNTASCKVVSSCATASYTVGNQNACTQDTTGNLCTSASVAASIVPFAPTTQATIAVTTASSNVALPAGSSTVLCNSGANPIFYKFGAVGVTAATTDIKLPSGVCIADAPGANGYIAAITGTSTSTLDISGGTGLPAFGTIPASGGGGAVNLTGINGVAPLVGTGVSGTGALRVAVSTDSTYTVAATESGTWTVQPGNTANTTAWLVNDSADMTGTVPGTAPSKTMVIGGIYNSTTPAPTNGQTLPLQMDADGALIAYAPNIIVTGNITTQNLNLGGAATAGSAVEMTTDARGVGSVQITGTWTGTLILQLTDDGVNWITAGGSPFQNDNTGAFSGSIPTGATGIWTVEVAGHAKWRVTASAAATGAAAVTLLSAQGTDRVNIGSNAQVYAQGMVAEAASAGGYNPVRMAGWNGTNLYTLRTDTSGQLLLGATANIVGKFTTDTTTPGTTNLVSAAESGTWTVATNADAAIAPGTAPSKAVVIGGVYNATPPAPTTGQTMALQQDADGSLYVNVRDQTIQRTYRAGMVGLVPAAAATDVFGVCGSATKTVIITRMQATGVATAATTADAIIVKRSTADTLGTSTAPALVPLDSSSVAATATALGYTANPTTGTLVGNVASQKIVLTTAAAASQMYPILQYWPNNITQGLTLRGTAECAYLNWNAQTIAGNSINVDAEWIETP